MTSMNPETVDKIAGSTASENQETSKKKWTKVPNPRRRKAESVPMDEPVDPDAEEQTVPCSLLQEKAVKTLQYCTGLGNTVSEEMLIEYAIPPLLLEMAQNVYIDETTPVMVNKVELPGRPTRPVDFGVFQSTYVPLLNNAAERLKKQKFSSRKEAFLVLCQMIRSYVPSLSAHKGKSCKWSENYTCSTVNHRTKTVEGKDCCCWGAKLEQQPDGSFRFTSIDDFNLHQEGCIKNLVRFGPLEVDFQESFPVASRSLVAKILKQPVVDETTVLMRKNRSKALLKKVDIEHLTKLVKDLDPIPQVCNYSLESVGTKEKPNEAYRLLQLLTQFQKNDGAFAKAFFEKDHKERLCLSMMSFIWPEGINLLRSHSDAIFCDSMWNVNEEGDYILTIVVVDKEEKLRLAASAIAFRESLDNWTQLFRWVKECVREFDPECIITDGADFIHRAFTRAMEKEVWHASCWWHRNRAVKRMFGKIGALAKNLQTMVYADSVEELLERENFVTLKLNELKNSHPRNASFRKCDLEKLYNILKDIGDHSFVTIPVFTGGTLSNSYAESINSCLRKIGLTACSSRMESLFVLRNYCSAGVHSIKGYSKAREVLLQTYMEPKVIEVVSNGVLRHQAKHLEQTEKVCKILREDGPSTVVEELIEKKLDKDWLIQRRAERIVTWEEGSDKVSCSCNALVYRGMPCLHIARVAIAKNYKIPLSCFHNRYRYVPPPPPPPSPPAHCECASADLPPSPPVDHAGQEQPGSSNAAVEQVRPSCASRDKSCSVTETFVSEAELHSTESYLNAKFSDPQSLRVRGEFRSIELTVLRDYSPYVSLEEMLQTIEHLRSYFKTKIDELGAEASDVQTVVPRATCKVGLNSYKTVPLRVAHESSEALKRNGQELGRDPKRRNVDG